MYFKHLNMAGASKKAMPKGISLDEYGDPPEPPSVEEIMDDIKKASLDDVVFKSSNAISKQDDGISFNSELLQVEDNTVMPNVDNRKELTPKQAYELSLKFVERSEKLNVLLAMLKDQSEKLKSLNEEVLSNLHQEDN